MFDSKKYHIIDLSQNLRPGILRADGSYTHGSPNVLYGEPRRLELRQFSMLDNEYMHFVETESHIGTHVEAPSHVMANGGKHKKDVSDFPVEKWIGEAIVLDFNHKMPVKGARQPITPEDLAEVKEGDIILGYNASPDKEIGSASES